MISMSAIGSAGGAATYYTQEQAAIEYYADEVAPSQWHGNGAEINGLSGSVSAKDLKDVLDGKVKEVSLDDKGRETIKEVKLGRTVVNEKGTKEVEHRAGWDMTFSAPKSVSIESEVFGNKDVQQAHKEAVIASMQWLEQDGAQTRVNRVRVDTGNLTYAMFDHATSREGDPQTHTHVLVANVTYHEGKAYSLSNERLMQMRTATDAVYKNELASRLQKIGYELEYSERGTFEIKGHNQQARDQFSKRSEQIKEALIEHGHDVNSASYEARQAATLATRQDKDHSESAEAHRDRWQEEAKGANVQEAIRINPKALESNVTAQEIISSAMSSVAEREQVFSKKDLVHEAMLQSSGRISSPDLIKEIDARAKSGELMQHEQSKSGVTYTTKAAIAAEKWADQRISEGVEGHFHVMNDKEFSVALATFEERKGFELKGEQREAAKSILTGSDQFQAVQGYAGTGKTTMVEFIREAAESKGWELKGMSTGAAQAEKLEQESGVKSSTTASFLAKEHENVGGTTKTLFIVDEASLAGQREFNGVIQATLQEGAKTLFLGDKDQHQSVKAGAALERAMGTPDAPKMQVDYLQDITRQVTEQAKEPVSLIMAGNHAEAIKVTAVEYSAAREAAALKWDALAEKQGGKLNVRQTEDRRESLKQARVTDNDSVIKAIAKDYAAQPKERRLADDGVMVITATNADRKALNDAIRAEIKSSGDLKENVNISTLRSKDITSSQKAQASSYSVGDVMKSETKRTVSHYTVANIDTAKNTVTVKDESGQYKTLKSDQYRNLQTYTQVFQEFSVNDRVAFLENSSKLNIKNGQAGTIQSLDGEIMRVKVGSQVKEINLREYKQIDHGYVSTSHKAQGQTVQQVWVHHNTEAGMHGQREAYVNSTRARNQTVTYTQDRDKASKQASAERNKTTAIGMGAKRTGTHAQSKGKDSGLYDGVKATQARDKTQAVKTSEVMRERKNERGLEMR